MICFLAEAVESLDCCWCSNSTAADTGAVEIEAAAIGTSVLEVDVVVLEGIMELTSPSTAESEGSFTVFLRLSLGWDVVDSMCIDCADVVPECSSNM